MKPVRIHREAQCEVDEAVDWYEQCQRGLGLSFLSEDEAALRIIQSDSAQSAPHSKEPFRYRRVNRFPYCVYFVESEDDVWIISVPHHRRNPGYWEHCVRGEVQHE